MKVLHVVAGLWTSTGGPASSVPTLCRGLAALGAKVTLLTGRGSLSDEVRSLPSGIRLRLEPLGPYAFANWHPEFARACRQEAGHADVVHGHGLWLAPNAQAAGAARHWKRPFVVSPRGMLDDWSIAQRGTVKSLIWKMGTRRDLDGAAAVHATSEVEANSIRRRGVKAPVKVIPNGVDLEGTYAEGGSLEPVGRRVVFLSRLHPKKGLEILLESWSRVCAAHPEAELVIAGDGDAEYVGEVKKRAAGIPRVTLRGPVHGDEKVRLLRSAWVVVLPSRSENYGMVVAEALACRAPVVVSRETPWEDVQNEGCGEWVSLDVEAFAAAMGRSLSWSTEERRLMGSRARAFVEAKHSARRTAESMYALYDELLIGRGRPS